MKKSLYLVLFLIALTVASSKIYAQNEFYKALQTCEEYSKQGSIYHSGQNFDILITLNKAKGNKCIYKEKIYQGKDYQMLTCNFEQSQLDGLSKSMKAYSDMFKKQILKNNIFEAKMTTNGEIFQKYLINPQYCKITHSKK